MIRFILAMGFLNNLNQKVLVIFILLINTCVYGLAKGQNDIDSIRITYGYHNGGYGIFRSTACYAFHKKAYKLQLEKSHNVHNARQLPKTISKESVSKLLNDCNTYAIEDRCEFIKITKDDYSNYIKIINDKDSLDNYLPFLDDFKKEQYELEEDAFMSLSRSDIVNIIESSISPTSFIGVHSKPTLIIELICNNAGSITIEPQWYFDGTPWKVLSQGKERYVGHEYVMSFLKDIQYDKYPLFWERFYLLLQIAESTNKGDTITEREFTSKVYDVVDEHPHFPGGNGALLDWLSKNIHYTSGCASIQGRVVVSFFVEPDGSLSDIELVRKVAPELDEEVLRVVKAMPKWIPASQNNKPIRAKFTMPITFRSE